MVVNICGFVKNRKGTGKLKIEKVFPILKKKKKMKGFLFNEIDWICAFVSTPPWEGISLKWYYRKIYFNRINPKGQGKVEKRQQWTNNANQILGKQVEDLTKLRELSPEGHSEKLGNPGDPKSLGSCRHQLPWKTGLRGMLLKTGTLVNGCILNG